MSVQPASAKIETIFSVSVVAPTASFGGTSLLDLDVLLVANGGTNEDDLLREGIWWWWSTILVRRKKFLYDAVLPVWRSGSTATLLLTVRERAQKLKRRQILI